MLLADLVAAADEAALTSSRLAKRDLLASALGAATAEDVGLVATLLAGAPRQGRIGIGWATIASVESPTAAEPELTVADLDGELDLLAALSGPGSAGARTRRFGALLGRATAAEQSFVRRLLLGELRQGALESALVEAIASAEGIPAAAVRRALMRSGDLGHVARVARTDGRAGLDAIGLTVGRWVQPMLASPSDDLAAALGPDRRPVVVEWKLDGARIQIHRDGDEVRAFTRTGNEVTGRLPGVVAMARALPVGRVVLDGEVLGLSDDARPEMFQDTMARIGRKGEPTAVGLAPWFFDALHLDGDDLLDRPLVERRAILAAVVPDHRIPGSETEDCAEAEQVLADALSAGHEGVMVKDPASPYAAGRRGAAWRKVKPVHLVDLVVLAAEWGSGRRRGWLSNLHLGAADGDGGFVMVGKTFKGLTDALLAWQTVELSAREVGQEGHVVHVRPELVVEVALDGVQRSSRYPGGVALRFARVRRYRDDKVAAEADTVETLQAMLTRSG